MKYEYDFTNFHLPKKEYELLKKHSSGNFQYTSELENLMSAELMRYSEFEVDAIGQQIPTGKCKISEKGLCYIQYREDKTRKYILTVIFSVLSLIATAVGVILSA